MKKIIILLIAILSVNISFASEEKFERTDLMVKTIGFSWSQQGKIELGLETLKEMTEECESNGGIVAPKTKKHLLGEGSSRRSFAVLVCIY